MPVSVPSGTVANKFNSAIKQLLNNTVSTCVTSSASVAPDKPISSNTKEDIHVNNDMCESLQSRLSASVKEVLITKLDYEEVEGFGHSVLDNLKKKYRVLTPTNNVTKENINAYDNISTNSATHVNNNSEAIGNFSNDAKAKIRNDSNELPQPKVVLYPRSKVQIGWQYQAFNWNVGAGMINLGSTCYMNATLQSLFHLPSFVNWLISEGEHVRHCPFSESSCVICAMYRTLEISQTSSSAIRPYYVYSKLKSICKHLLIGHQEDAHEFLRYLIDAMEKCYLSRIHNHHELDQYSKETTPLSQILGGYLKSSVRCLTCNHVSVTFQHFQDLLLDIRNVDTVEDALDVYFSRERLEDMGYKCEGCNKKVIATKQFTLERAPIALCLQLKRFTLVGTKLSKPLLIRSKLDLSKYITRRLPGEQITYRLVSMITHLGSSQQCGHYIAIVVTESGTYYTFDDCYVRSMALPSVYNTNAYIIFYEIEQANCNDINCSSAINNSTEKGIDALTDIHRNNSNKLNRTLSPNDHSTNNDISYHLNNATVSVKLDSETHIANSSKKVANKNKHNNRNVRNYIKSNPKRNINGKDGHKLTPENVENFTNSDNTTSSKKVLLESNGTSDELYTSPDCHLQQDKFNRSSELVQHNITTTKNTATSNLGNSKTTPQIMSPVPYDSETYDETEQSSSAALSDQHKHQLIYDALSDKNISKTISGKMNYPKDNENEKTYTFTTSTSTATSISPSIIKLSSARMLHSRELLSTTSVVNDTNLIQQNKNTSTMSTIRIPIEVKENTKDYQSNKIISSSPPIIKTKTGPWHVTSLQTSNDSRDNGSLKANATMKSSKLINTPIITNKKSINPKNPFSTAKSPKNSADSSTSNCIKRYKSDFLDTNSIDGYKQGKEPYKLAHRSSPQYGYGADIYTWHGQLAEINQDITSKEKEQQRRDWKAADDIEIDRGRRKKTKITMKNRLIQNRLQILNTYNSFQKCENRKNSNSAESVNNSITNDSGVDDVSYHRRCEQQRRFSNSRSHNITTSCQRSRNKFKLHRFEHYIKPNRTFSFTRSSHTKRPFPFHCNT